MLELIGYEYDANRFLVIDTTAPGGARAAWVKLHGLCSLCGDVATTPCEHIQCVRGHLASTNNGAPELVWRGANYDAFGGDVYARKRHRNGWIVNAAGYAQKATGPQANPRAGRRSLYGGNGRHCHAATAHRPLGV